MTTSTRRQSIVLNRASLREQQEFLNDLGAAASFFPCNRSLSLSTDGSGTWLTAYTTNPYPPSVAIKMVVEALGVVTGSPTHSIDFRGRATFQVDAAGTIAMVYSQNDYFYRTDLAMNVQLLINADKTISVQVRDAAAGVMRYLVVVYLLEMSA